jgi:dolichol-phosphate mannosyltransferase
MPSFGALKKDDTLLSDRVLVIMAALNEEEGIGPTIDDLKHCLRKADILVVDGKSVDHTIRIAKDRGTEILVQEGKGKGKAIAQAVQRIGEEVDFVVFIDGDFTYPAEFLPSMIDMLHDNPEVGMITGNRFNGHFRLTSMHNILYFGNRLLAFTHNLFNGVQMRDPLTGVRVVRAEILRDWMPKSKGFDIEVELNHLVENHGFTIAEIPIYYRTRRGKKKLGVKHGFTIFRRILSESF